MTDRSPYQNFTRNYSDQIRQVAAGGLSAIICRVVVQPFDVVKIRLQMQQYSETSKPRYRGILNCASSIVKDEGVRALWKGHIAGQILSIIYGSSQFLVYNSVNSRLTKMKNSKNNNMLNGVMTPAVISFLSGGASGTFSTITSYPFDTVRTRMGSQFGYTMYSGTLDAMRKIYRNEGGYRAFFKGIVPSLTEVFIGSGITFATYSSIKSIYRKNFKKEDNVNADLAEKYWLLLFGCVAGAVSRIITVPINTIKKRLQNRGFESNLVYMGDKNYYTANSLQWFINAMSQKNRIKVLYAGAGPSLLKSFVYSGLIFFTYEIILAKISVL